jgi:hypothetical protein
LSDIIGEFHISETARTWITGEVERQLAPLRTAVDLATAQNAHQLRTMAELDAWRKALWGNGTGPAGYLDHRFKDLHDLVANLNAKVLRGENRDELRSEIEENRIRIAEVRDAARTHRWERWHYGIAIAITGGSFVGAWVLSLIRPLARHLIEQLMKAW